jgi:hypothetical protein
MRVVQIKVIKMNILPSDVANLFRRYNKSRSSEASKAMFVIKAPNARHHPPRIQI